MALVAGAYRTSTTILLHPTAHTQRGLAVLVPPVRRLPKDADPIQVGFTLRELLRAPQAVIPPDNWKARVPLSEEFLKQAGYRSWKKLNEGARYCWIEATDGTIALTPLRNGGSRGDKKGFQPFGAPLVTVEEGSGDADLGAAVIEALNRSE